jgi:rod shape-determining protein MreD
MMERRAEPGLAVAATTLVALALQALPLPYWLSILRPAFVVIAVLYWSVLAPRAGGIALGFLAGLSLDVFRGSVLGQHALAVSLVTYLAIRFHLQIRNKPIFQQALFAFAALALYELVVWAIDGWSGHPVASSLRWLHPITGGLFWPVAVILLDRARTAR